MLGSTCTGQEGLQCGFRKWMGKAGQAGVALLFALLLGLIFFFLEIRLRAIRIQALSSICSPQADLFE